MQVINGKALLLKVKNPKQVTAVIPKSKELSMNEVVVNWGLDEAHTLSGLNINVPSPITKRYSWPGQYKPFDHQKSTASFLTMNKKNSLAKILKMFLSEAKQCRGKVSCSYETDLLLSNSSAWL